MLFYLKLGFHIPVKDVELDLRRSLMKRMKKLKLIRPNTATPATRALVTVSSSGEGSLDGAISKPKQKEVFVKKHNLIVWTQFSQLLETLAFTDLHLLECEYWWLKGISSCSVCLIPWTLPALVPLLKSYWPWLYIHMVTSERTTQPLMIIVHYFPLSWLSSTASFNCVFGDLGIPKDFVRDQGVQFIS